MDSRRSSMYALPRWQRRRRCRNGNRVWYGRLWRWGIYPDRLLVITFRFFELNSKSEQVSMSISPTSIAALVARILIFIAIIDTAIIAASLYYGRWELALILVLMIVGVFLQRGMWNYYAEILLRRIDSKRMHKEKLKCQDSNGRDQPARASSRTEPPDAPE